MAMMIVGWLLLGGVVWLAMDGWVSHQENPNAVLAQATDGNGEVAMRRNRAGHFVAPGRINGVPVVFMVDTGATHVALPEMVARQVGARPGPAMRAQTAAGETVSYATRLDSVSLGGLTAHAVSGTIVPEMEGDTVLLGMSFLSRFSITIHDGEMVLRPRDRMSQVPATAGPSISPEDA